MKKRLFLAFLAIMMMVAPLPTLTPSVDAAEIGIVPTLWAGQAGTVTGSGVNVRTGPGTGFGTHGTVALGTAVLHLGSFSSQPDGWWENVRITSGPLNGREGWIRGDFLGNWHTPPVQPVQTFIRPMTTGRVTSEFRSASRPNHHGIDLASSNSRQPILAVAAGTVIHVVSHCVEGDRSCGGGFGNWVVIQHNVNGQRVDTLYAHLTRVDVRVGDSVTQGRQIGTKGNTGDSTGPHLHFEVHPGGRVSGAASAVNPRNWVNFPALQVLW